MFKKCKREKIFNKTLKDIDIEIDLRKYTTYIICNV